MSYSKKKKLNRALRSAFLQVQHNHLVSSLKKTSNKMNKRNHLSSGLIKLLPVQAVGIIFKH